MTRPRVERVEKIIIDKHDLSVLQRASEILSSIYGDYDCSNAVDENCSFEIGMLCSSLNELLDMTVGE